jgi:hypothetical protein
MGLLCYIKLAAVGEAAGALGCPRVCSRFRLRCWRQAGRRQRQRIVTFCRKNALRRWPIQKAQAAKKFWSSTHVA